MNRVAIVLVASLLCGCVTYDRHVKLEPVTGSAAASVATGKSIAVLVEDQRAGELGGQIVGHTKNGFGMKMAAVLADEKDPKAWVVECVTADLKRAGFEVRSSGADAGAEMQVHVDLAVCYAQAYGSYGAEIAADVMVARGGTVLLPKSHFSGKATYGMNWGATAASYQAVLHEAMKKFLDEVTPAIAQAAKSGPSP